MSIPVAAAFLIIAFLIVLAAFIAGMPSDDKHNSD